MADTLPQLRADIQVSVHQEAGETFLVLHDVMGFAEGPIMVHADMMGVLEVCDGTTTWEQVAAGSEVALDGPEMLQLRAFLGELDTLGYFETEHAEKRRQQTLDAWSTLETRPPVCAGSTYPSEADELRAFLDDMLSTESGERKAESAEPVSVSDLRSPVSVYLIPHIDFRVSPQVYAPAFNALKNSDSDLFVMIGTSHYWSDDRLILTEKHFETPIGIVETDRPLVQALRDALSQPPLPIPHSPVSETDLAHKPEHSLELHAVLLKHVMGDRPFTILPILVTGFGGENDPQGREEILAIGTAVRQVVQASGRSATWLISGDLAHVGQRFGDPMPADVLLPSVKEADQDLLNLLKAGDVGGYHQVLEDNDHAYRICGHAPTVLTLDAVGPVQGRVLAYDVWDDRDTGSAVTFATMAFGGTASTP